MHMRGLLTFLWFAILASSAIAQPLRGTVHEQSFFDWASGRTVNFNIYLPEGYDIATDRYPVVYHLHGLGGTQGGPQNMHVPRSFETAQAQGIIGSVIVVFPNGYTNAWWADGIDGDKPAETDVVSRLIPYVDATYRTIPRRGARVIQGFSMGGFGATKFYSKFPDLFSICVEYDAAFVTWAGMQLYHTKMAAEIFGNNEDYFNQFSPWVWADTNAVRLSETDSIRMVVGALAGGNRTFREYLLARKIPVDFIETTCGHDLGCLFEEEGLASAAFIADRLVVCPADHNADGDVNSQDLFNFLAAFFVADPIADFTADGTVNSQDFFEYLGAFFVPC
jgi:enterochelin esterase-like enzyme